MNFPICKIEKGDEDEKRSYLTGLDVYFLALRQAALDGEAYMYGTRILNAHLMSGALLDDDYSELSPYRQADDQEDIV